MSAKRTIIDPRDVPGFRDAEARGWLPVVPSAPPSLKEGPTAIRAGVECFAACFGGGSVAIFALSALAPAGAVSALVMCLVALVTVVLFVRTGNAQLAEVAAGYVVGIGFRSITFPRGMSALLICYDRDGRWHREYSVPLDTRGLWRLDGAGQVLREPDRNILPPGWYPSPNRIGEFELWTGVDWAYRYLPTPDQRTDTTPRFGRTIPPKASHPIT